MYVCTRTGFGASLLLRAEYMYYVHIQDQSTPTPPPATQSLILTPPHQKQTKPIAIINQVVRKSYRVSQGPHFALAREKKAAELTKEMLDSGEWATAAFKVGPSVRPSVSLVSLVL